MNQRSDEMIKKLLAKINRKKQNSVKRLSNSITLNINSPLSIEKLNFDDFTQVNLESRVRELENVLELAEKKTNEFKNLVDELNQHNDDIEAEEIIKKIIDSCDEVSLNGIKILAGDEVSLSLYENKLNIKLPNFARDAFGLEKNNLDLNSAQTKILELNNAILKSKEEVLRCQKDLDVSKENIKSAGIDISSLERLILDSK